MATTRAGTRLTEKQRQRQLVIRAAALRDFLDVWAALSTDKLDDSAAAYLRLASDLVGRYRAESADVAADYYRAFRIAETGDATVIPISRARNADPQALSTSLTVTGPIGIKSRVARGADPVAARQLALVESSGAVTRHVLDGGRRTIQQTLESDRAVKTWARVTGAAPCAFCAMLATRGYVYLSYDTAARTTTRSRRGPGHRYHDNCSCTVEPGFAEKTPLPPQAQQFQDLYYDATSDVYGVEKWHRFKKAYENADFTQPAPS